MPLTERAIRAAAVSAAVRTEETSCDVQAVAVGTGPPILVDPVPRIVRHVNDHAPVSTHLTRADWAVSNQGD
jgi:hypothetical protein